MKDIVILNKYNKFDIICDGAVSFEECGLYLGATELTLDSCTNTVIDFSDEESRISARLTVTNSDSGFILGLTAQFKIMTWEAVRTFDMTNAIELRFKLAGVKNYLSKFMYNYYWSEPRLCDMPDKTQQVLFEAENGHGCIIAATGEKTKTQLKKSGKFFAAYVSIGACGYSKIDDNILTVGYGDGAYSAVENASSDVSKTQWFITPKKDEKSVPKFVGGLGWCTWNSFYHDVTAEGIEKKLIEFKEKSIPVKWILIDDGWFGIKDEMITTFYEDREKFPDGLKSFITRIKKEYEIDYVGVWQTLNCYWNGVYPNSEAQHQMGDRLISTNAGMIINDVRDAFKLYSFYCEQHKYLKDCGVDFVKIDNQNGIRRLAEFVQPEVISARNAHAALEKSVLENLNGNMINCMGMDEISTFSRPYSLILRNSDDFFPDKKGSFKRHIIQNAFNAIFNDYWFMCDFDMWWTKHESAKQSGVLRAISGGPLYISDKIGETEKSALLPLVDDDGFYPICDRNARPTEDCIFHDYFEASKVLKLYNSYNGNPILAAFNLSEDKTQYSISLGDAFASESEYIIYLHFAKTFHRLKKGELLSLELDGSDCEIINFYTEENGQINVGDTSKYISCAHRGRKISTENI